MADALWSSWVKDNEARAGQDTPSDSGVVAVTPYFAEGLDIGTPDLAACFIMDDLDKKSPKYPKAAAVKSLAKRCCQNIIGETGAVLEARDVAAQLTAAARVTSNHTRATNFKTHTVCGHQAVERERNRGGQVLGKDDVGVSVKRLLASSAATDVGQRLAHACTAVLALHLQGNRRMYHDMWSGIVAAKLNVPREFLSCTCVSLMKVCSLTAVGYGQWSCRHMAQRESMKFGKLGPYIATHCCDRSRYQWAT